MRALKAAALFTFVVIVSVACAVSSKTKNQQTTPSANTNQQPAQTTAPGQEAKTAATGERASADTGQLYTSKCAMCHGSTGKGATPGTPDLTNPAQQNKKTLAEFAEVIKAGKKPVMPAFGNQLSNEQIQALAQYVHNFTKK